uniref:Uncharacterized protein n=1 Tax=Glossina palpalis gambiensis TaxID=67801 RepID=A0A1B0B2J5_9MUSC
MAMLLSFAMKHFLGPELYEIIICNMLIDLLFPSAINFFECSVDAVEVANQEALIWKLNCGSVMTVDSRLFRPIVIFLLNSIKLISMEIHVALMILRRVKWEATLNEGSGVIHLYCFATIT